MKEDSKTKSRRQQEIFQFFFLAFSKLIYENTVLNSNIQLLRRLMSLQKIFKTFFSYSYINMYI